jgi:hypothetical protein
MGVLRTFGVFGFLMISAATTGAGLVTKSATSSTGTATIGSSIRGWCCRDAGHCLMDLDFLGIVIGNIPHKGIFKMLNYQD